MTFYPADHYSLLCFLTLIFLLALVYYHWLTSKTWLIIFTVLTFIFSISSYTGLTQNAPQIILPLAMMTLFILGILFSFSSAADQHIKKTSLFYLVAFQGFRVPLELILHHWANIGTVPQEMTWTGSNPDILAGIAAIVFAPLTLKYKSLAWIPQIIGSFLLLNVIRVILFTSPLPFAWPLETPLQLGLHFPYVLIAPLCVLPAFIAHLLTFRKLLSQSKL